MTYPLSESTRFKDFTALVRKNTQHKLTLLMQLTTFPLGRFLIHNEALNSEWTHYVVKHPFSQNKELSSLEDFLLNRAPLFLALRDCFVLFEKRLKTLSKTQIAIYVDREPHMSSLEADNRIARFQEPVDVITRHSWNICERDDARIVQIYTRFCSNLRPGGRLIMNALTPLSEWNMSVINAEDLALQQLLFTEILAFKWQAVRSSGKVVEQLQSAGFSDVEIFPDRANIFPTFIAKRGL